MWSELQGCSLIQREIAQRQCLVWVAMLLLWMLAVYHLNYLGCVPRLVMDDIGESCHVWFCQVFVALTVILALETIGHMDAGVTGGECSYPITSLIPSVFITSHDSFYLTKLQFLENQEIILRLDNFQLRLWFWCIFIKDKQSWEK